MAFKELDEKIWKDISATHLAPGCKVFLTVDYVGACTLIEMYNQLYHNARASPCSTMPSSLIEYII